MAKNCKVQEGLEYLTEAEKHLKTGFFKWKPDYDSAAACYQKAALAFKIGKSFEKARDAYLKLADAHYRCGARFHAAKAYEEAAFASKELKDLNKALSYYDHASDLYMENGTPDTAAMCLQKAGKIVEQSEPDWAISTYLKAAEIWESEDQNRFRQAAELVGKVARLQVQHNKLPEAVKSITHERQLLGHSEGGDNGAGARLTCGLVLVHLHLGDQVRAEQSIFDACDNIPNFDGSEEHDALHNLIEAFDSRDQDKVNAILNTPMFKFMDNVYAKLARSLRVPGYSDKPKLPQDSVSNETSIAQNTDNAVANNQSTNQESILANENFEEGELC